MSITLFVIWCILVALIPIAGAWAWRTEIAARLGFHFHWQNLNEKRGGKHGWGIRHGRCWLSHGNNRPRARSARAEWCFKLQPEIGFSFNIGGMMGDGALLALHCPVLSLYLGLSTPLIATLQERMEKRDGLTTGIKLAWDRDRVSNGPELRIDIASRDASWRSDDPWWMQGKTIAFWDILFGRMVYKTVEGEAKPIVIPMPEGCYNATATRYESEWKRPRLPWVSCRRVGFKVEIPGGIPFAGKGENSWDCGDDGLWGTNPDAETIEEAIGSVVASVLRSRGRYGQASWLCGKAPVMAPERPKPAQQENSGSGGAAAAAQ